ncbi:MAG: hypothetical protein R6X19_00310 [Kiritimatiellia bacterium]
MKRLSSSLLVVLFVLGALIIPFMHQAHCADGHVSKNAGHCLICQTAHTPLQLSPVSLAPVCAVRAVVALLPFVPVLLKYSPRSVTQPRAPPV